MLGALRENRVQINHKIETHHIPGEQLVFGPKSNPLPLERVKEGFGSRRKIGQKNLGMVCVCCVTLRKVSLGRGLRRYKW